jgi:drug/metabolite transporter (DMT)-like permease
MKKQKSNGWFLIGIASAVLAAPNATVIRYSVGNIDPFLFNLIRFLVIAVLTTPFLLRHLGRLRKSNTRDAVKAGAYTAMAAISYVWAIKLSQASYVSIIILVTPIVFIFLSSRFTSEKVSSRTVAGITLAAMGAMLIVVLPVAIHQKGAVVFYPLATFLALVNAITFSLALIYSKKANESGIPIVPLISVSSWIIFITNLLIFLAIGGVSASIGRPAVIGILYSGIIVCLVAQTMRVESYERIGGAITGVIEYLEIILAIILPLILLGEKLSVEMVIGGIMILSGLYVVEYHKSKTHKHMRRLRTH